MVRSLGTRNWLIITVCWVVWSLFHTSRLRAVVPEITWSEALLYGLPDALIWIALTPIPVAVARRYPFPSERVWREAAIHLAAGSLVAIAHTQLDALFNVVISYLSSDQVGFAYLSRHLLVHSFHANLAIYLAISGVVMYLGRLETLRERERQAVRLRTQLSEARLAALRAQIRPHFLFNALHTVGALVERDPRAGRRVLRQLGELLRASLATDGGQLLPLRREVELCRSYLEIERARFGERLSVEIEIDEEAMQCSFPPLLLQPLIENAIRHGIEGSPTPGTVRITGRRRGDRVVLQVSDDGPGAHGELREIGIGLASVRERLREHYGPEHSLEISPSPGFTVTLEIPYSAAESRTGEQVVAAR